MNQKDNLEKKISSLQKWFEKAKESRMIYIGTVLVEVQVEANDFEDARRELELAVDEIEECVRVSGVNYLECRSGHQLDLYED